ncbi:MAG: hypothetical protein OXC42_03075 [Gammaproteobacteria bacterium]|nr:hypothetical protein [Gammaproteobacteria bacterium]
MTNTSLIIFSNSSLFMVTQVDATQNLRIVFLFHTAMDICSSVDRTLVILLIRATQKTRSYDSIFLKEFGPVIDSTANNFVKRDCVAIEKLYFETRNIKVFAEISGEGTFMPPGRFDTGQISGDHSVFRFVAFILKVGKFDTRVFDVILEILQFFEPGVEASHIEYVIAEMPSLAGAFPCQVLIEIIVIEPTYSNP